MKIAGVGVNPKRLPEKKVLIKQALKSTKYYQMSNKKALPLIEKEIKASGLFSTSKKRVTKPDVDAKKSRRLSNTRKRSVDKGKDS